MPVYYFYLGYLTHYLLSVRQKAGESIRTNTEGNRGHILNEKYIKDTSKHCQNGFIVHLRCCDHAGQSILQTNA